MSKRNIEIKVRLNRKEAEALNKRVKKSRLSREAYLRHLISGVVPQDAPPPDYFDFMRELHGVETTSTRSPRKLMCWVSLMSAAMMKKCGSSISSSGTSPKL